MLTKNIIRGCGTRKSGGCYLCVGTSPHGQPIEYFIKDPGIPWSYPYSRAPKILPDENGINHVYMWIMKGYDSPYFHFMEIACGGLSRLVSNTFPIEQLTPFQSEIRCIYPKGIPEFEFVGNENENNHYSDCKIWPRWEQLQTEGDLTNEEWSCLGQHPVQFSPQDKFKTAKRFCTFAHKDISIWLANPNQFTVKGSEEFTIHFPSTDNEEFTYGGHFGKCVNENDNVDNNIVTNKDNWQPAILLTLPISHIEFPEVENEQFAERAKKSGFDTFVLPY